MMAEGFLNPYTFVPAFPRDTLPKPLRDNPPPSRDQRHPDRWSGRIHVSLTTETPLLLLDPTRSRAPSDGENDHSVYPVRVRNGRPHLATTAVKGLLRSAFEAATNSRFGIFEGHQEPLGFRRDAGFALKLVPVRVAGNGRLERFKTAPLEMYDVHGNLLPGRSVAHMQKTKAFLQRTGKNRLEAIVARPGEAPRGRRVDGIAYVTGPTIEGKRFERFFYRDSGECMQLARDWKEIEADWHRLIANYRNAHNDEELYERPAGEGRVAMPGERIGGSPGKLAWSPHIYDADHQNLAVGTLCYAHVNGGKVERLYPVLIPRDVYPVSPADLLHPSLHPARCYGELSPADRLFGWVAPSGGDARPSSYRGRLRVGPVTCSGDADAAVRTFTGNGLPLAILSAPKPQQGRFYVAESTDRPDEPIKDRTQKADIYRRGRGLRGRKAYWHHAGLDTKRHWEVPAGGSDPAQDLVGGRYREYLRPRTIASETDPLTRDRKHFATAYPEQRDSQNQSIGGWVNPGTTFYFAVEVRDVDACELGALVWLLTLPAGHFHKLGHGRPLGFGSVRLNIENAELHNGNEYKSYYRTLSGSLPDRDWRAITDAAREQFDTIVESSPALRTVRQAMLAVTRGAPDLPVHYPRVRDQGLDDTVPTPPDPRGLQYKWFTANEQMSDRAITRGRGRSLPPVDSRRSLEIYRDEEKEDSLSKGANGRKQSTSGSSRHRARRPGGKRQ
ncbi:TIGR03986 family CRISPR-associated RAMP protein [Nonomuraea sp. NPDC048892]|uniref:TIGR03986 family type III CRISPR-associated RAMP protein n=1 Tax=Nonomuraea sp. NPDC048892 TaxID=3154624 RepID=UPI0033F54EC2